MCQRREGDLWRAAAPVTGGIRGRLQQETLGAQSGRGQPSLWIVVRTAQTSSSGGERQGMQSLQSGVELVFSGPVSEKVQGEETRLAGEAPRQREEASPEGLGGCHRLAQTNAFCPAGEIVGDDLGGQACDVGGEAPRGGWLRPTPYFRSRMAFSISAWRRWSASKSRVLPPLLVMKA